VLQKNYRSTRTMQGQRTTAGIAVSSYSSDTSECDMTIRPGPVWPCGCPPRRCRAVHEINWMPRKGEGANRIAFGFAFHQIAAMNRGRPSSTSLLLD